MTLYGRSTSGSSYIGGVYIYVLYGFTGPSVIETDSFVKQESFRINQYDSISTILNYSIRYSTTRK
jgi:hypothetical protein